MVAIRLRLRNPIARRSSLDDRTRAEALAWEAQEETAVFTGRHHGFEALDPPATHERRLALDGSAETMTLTDTVRSPGEHDLQWTFPLAPCTVQVGEGAAIARFEAASLTVEAAGVTFAVDEGWLSPRYGVRQPTLFLRARRRAHPGEDVTVFILRSGESHNELRGIDTNAV